MNLHIRQITVRDTYAIKLSTFGFSAGDVGQVIRIRGRNGSGKSSWIAAISYALGGGTDPEVIRRWRCTAIHHSDSPTPQDWLNKPDIPLAQFLPCWKTNAACPTCKGLGYIEAEKSVIEILLSDGTFISKTTRLKRVRKGASEDEWMGGSDAYTMDIIVDQPDGHPRKPPQAFLNELGTMFDPGVLLRHDATKAAGRRALADELMKLVPFSFDPGEVIKAVSYRSKVEVPRGSEDVRVVELSDAPLKLEDLKKISAQVTDERRRAGQTRDDCDGSINRLQKSLPEGTPADVSRDLKAAEDYRRLVEAALVSAKNEVWQEANSALLAAEKQTQQEIRKLEQLLSDRKLSLEADRVQRCEAIEAEAKPELEKAIAGIERFKAQAEAQQRAVTLKQEMEVQLTTLRIASWKYNELTGVLERLETLRTNELKNLPVAGLVVEDGAPYLDGIPWAKVNLSRRVEAVLQIGCLQSGKMPLILWDNAEHGDSATRDGIEAGLVEAGYSVLECIVSDGPLTIEMVEPAQGAGA